MKIFFSGYGCKYSNPEVALGTDANVMLTFFDSSKKVHPRFKAVHAARVKAAKQRKERGSGN